MTTHLPRAHSYDMTNTHTTYNPQVTGATGAYSVLAVSFAEDNNAYKALTVLKELDAQQRVGVQEGVVVERTEDGRVIEKDKSESMFMASTAGGGLLGLLIGIIGGPLGMIIGGTTGVLFGSLIDIADMEETDSALAGISGAVQVGHTAVLAVVSEPSYEVIDTAMAELGGTVVRRPVAEVEAEAAAAEDAERQAKREARKELLKGRHEQNKAAINTKVEALKAKLHHAEKAPA